ncbi:hypothetical protein ACIBO4_03870 [Streptomyces sp. NPDC050149]|uniref:hypothetical protein n=1 Tax=Streptomyces sp. NPDC050149 TaxID=3365603 RepID=UPI0037ABC10C
MAFTLASHTTLVPLGVALPLITLVMHYRGLLSLVLLVMITLFVTSEDAPHVRHGLAHGVGPAVGIAAGAASLLTAVLLVRKRGRYARATAVVFLYWLDSRGDLEELTEADLRQGGDPRDGDRPDTA